MQFTPFKAVPALFFALLLLSACRSATRDTTAIGDALQSDPSIAAKRFFAGHYDFYYEDPSPSEAVLTPRFFRILRQNYDAFTITGQIGALDRDPWINAQDGHVSEPYKFKTLKVYNSESVVRFEYKFALGPKLSLPQSVLMKFQRSSSSGVWQLADFIMPNSESLVDLLERNP